MHSTDHHIFHYLVLLLGLLFFSVLYYFFRYNSTTSYILILSACFFYASWGILHHKYEGRFTKLIGVEYISLAIFAAVLLITATSLL